MKRGFFINYILSFFMFICAFYPWISFLIKTVSGPPLSISAVLIILLTASFIFIFFQSSGYIVPISSASFFISIFTLTSVYYNQLYSSSFFSFYFFPDKSLSGIFSYILLFIFTLTVWTAAFRIISISPEGNVMRRRFDAGLSSFFILLLIKLIITVKGGSISAYENTAGWFVLFLAAGLLSSAIKNSRGKPALLKSALVIILFSVLVILLSFSICYFFSPGLKAAAATGSGILGTAGSGFEKILAVFIRFFLDFRFRNKILNNVFAAPASAGPGLGGSDVPEEIFLVYLGFTVLIILFCLSVIMFFVIRMIIRHIIKNRDLKKGNAFNLKSFLIIIKKFLRYLMMKEITQKEILYYRYLKTAGRFKGVRFTETETPYEYADRLSARLPLCRNEIQCIVKTHSDFIYGGIKADREGIKEVRSSLKKVINPMIHLKRK